jgi:putative endonuclease
MIECDDGSFYTGYCRNLSRRVKQHVMGRGARYLRIHKPRELVYVEEFGSRVEAMRRERCIKLYSRARKLELKGSGVGAGRRARWVVKKKERAASFI